MRHARFLIVLCAAALAACAPSLKSQYTDVARAVHEKTGHAVNWDPAAPADAAIPASIRPILSRPVSPSDAVHIALVNNQSMQATLNEIGISRADMIQAGLLGNPTLFSRLRWDTGPEHDVSDYEFRATQNFMDLVTVPLKRRAAREDLERAKERVAQAAIDLAARVRIACCTLAARMQALDEQSRLVDELESAASTGGANERSNLKARLALAQARQAEANLNSQVDADYEALNRLMGLSGPLADEWQLADDLPPIPPDDPPCDNVEQKALEGRLDLAVSRRSTARLEKLITLQQVTRWVPVLNVGVDYERKSDILRVFGPVLTVEIPIFDWGQGRLARSRALLAQSRHQTAALENEIRSSAREACSRLRAARAEVDFYGDELLPGSRRLSSMSSRGSSDWLSDRQSEAAARQKSIEARRDYWIARTRLSQLIGPSGG